MNVKLTHNQGSRAFVASPYAKRVDDQEPNRMEWFKISHYSQFKGWKNPESQAAYVRLLSAPIEEGQQPRTIDSIVDEVLGTNPSYIKGLGYGPKPNGKQTSNASTTSRLEKAEGEVEKYKSNFQLLRDHLQTITAAMLANGIDVPMPNFPGSNEPNSPSSESLSTEQLD
ncbi:hypothetical protein COLO4_35859 [Corchorus olitorius]|uniref:Transposase, Ptta/En/Spm, plant n=1 Tax=Corchorus olitorius TaxID=93759 RepID=A0A1R3GCN5_9ROSI|nr:hypothetical protein COLO4_35859 [Corchorus olitorius]